MPAADTFTRTVLRHQLVPPDSLIVVAVSGGVDSLALLHLLYTSQIRLGCQLHVATLDHGLRGEAGAQDAQYVAELAQKWGLEVTVGRADVPALAVERGLGIEAAARLERYRFLAEVARKAGAQRIALAHHADDQAETVLMHLLRGAGLEGLSGMAYQSPHPFQPDLMLIRPLLGLARAELEAYCAENGLMPRHDVTNEDVSYARNRLRHEVLPYLEALYPQVKRSLVQLADIAAAEDELAREQFAARILPHVSRQEERVKISRSVFISEHRALQRRFVRRAAEQLGATDNLAYTHIIAALEIMLNGKVGAVAQLPDSLQARLDYDAIIVERSDATAEGPEGAFLLTSKQEVAVAVPGVTPLEGGWDVHVAAEPPSLVIDGSRRAVAALALSADDRVVVRTRNPGDRIRVGSEHTQRVKQWMIDRKIAKALRDFLPLLVVNDQVAAVLWNHEWEIFDPFRSKSDVEGAVLYIWFEKSNE